MTSLINLPVLAVFIYLFLFVNPAGFSQTDPIADLENQLFFRQYADENENIRLNRLENYIFGKQFSDSTENRIARLKGAVPDMAKASPVAPVPTPAPQNNSGLGESPWVTQPGNQSGNQPINPQPTNPSDENSDNSDQQMKVMEARANQINTLLNNAVSVYRQKQYPQAIDLFQQVIRLDPQNAAAHFSLGIAMEADGKLPEAQDQYNQAITIDPDNKDYKAARDNVKNKIDAQSKNKLENYKWEFLASEAADALKNSQFDQALTMYTELVQKDPKQALYQYNMGTCYLMLKKPDDALMHYKLAHKLDPSDHVYEESLQKLEQSLKEEKKAKETKEVQEKAAKQNTPKKVNLLTTCGLELKPSKQGLMIKKVTLGSRAAMAGLYPFDVIKMVDGQPVTKQAQLEQIIGSKPPGQRMQFILLRRNVTCQLLF